MPKYEDDRKPKSFRVSTSLWDRFKEACDANYTNRTEKLNEFISSYVHRHEISKGIMSPELYEALEDELTQLVRKQSLLILQQIMGRLTDEAVNEGDINEALGMDDGQGIRELLD